MHLVTYVNTVLALLDRGTVKSSVLLQTSEVDCEGSLDDTTLSLSGRHFPEAKRKTETRNSTESEVISFGTLDEIPRERYDEWIREPNAWPEGLDVDQMFVSLALKTRFGDTVPFRKKRKVHIISAGRSGSTFFTSLLNEAGIPSVYEPLAVDSTAGPDQIGPKAALSGNRASEKFACLYGYTRSDEKCASFMNMRKMASIMHSEAPQVGMKTIRLLHLDAVRPVLDLDKKESHDSLPIKSVLLLRDPRGLWNSAKKKRFKAGKVDIDFVCRSLNLLLTTLPEFTAAVGRANVLPLVYEHWAADLPRATRRLAEFLGLERFPYRWRAHETMNTSVLSWQEELRESEIQALEGHAACKSYMKAMKYPFCTGSARCDESALYAETRVPTPS